MNKNRYSVSDIAEVLIEEISEFKKSANLIKDSTNKLMQTKVDINEDSLKRFDNLIDLQAKNQNAFIERLEDINKKNKLRPPSWLIGLLLAFTVLIAAFAITTYREINKVRILEYELDLYKGEIDDVN